MLRLLVLGDECYNEEKNEFFTEGDFVLELEHSLISISKWESRFNKPFLGSKDKTIEETYGYIEAMVISENPPENFVKKLSDDNIKKVNEYIDSNQSGTTFFDESIKKGREEIISAELIYYWLVAYQIPFEVQHWHLSRLFALIRICGIKNSKPKKMSRREADAQRRSLNQQRRAALNTTG